MKREERKWMTLPALAMVLMSCVSAYAATECVWVGGSEGSISASTNWFPATVPSSSSRAYIAVFTNSVSLTTSSTSTHWYPSGIVISNNAVVTYASGYRCYPSSATENGEFVLSIESGSSFACNAMLFGSTSLTLVKMGGGRLTTKSWLGNPNSKGSAWKSVDIRAGTTETSAANPGMVSIEDTLRIRSGAKAVIGYSSPFAAKVEETYSFHQPRIEIDEGGNVTPVQPENP